MTDDAGREDYTYPNLSEDEDREQRGSDPPSTKPDTEEPTAPKPTSEEEVRREKEIEDYVDRQGKERPHDRQDQLWPYLLIRGFAGDDGARPMPGGQPFWESTDVLVVPGTVDAYDGVSATLHPQPGVAHTVFVRVWNLGRFAAYGVRVRAWWANPSFSFDDPAHPPHIIGAEIIDLANRRSTDCVRLVRIRTPWTPVVENDGHECLLAKAECFADGAGPGFDASMDRHVGQRNLTLATANIDVKQLFITLGEAVPAGARLQLVHGLADLEQMVLVHQPQVLGELVSPMVDASFGRAFDVEDRATGRLREFRSLASISGIRTPNIRLDKTEPAYQADRLASRSRRAAPRIDREAPPVLSLMESIGIREFSAGAIADRLGGGARAGHLLRFVAHEGDKIIGGYSVIVARGPG